MNYKQEETFEKIDFSTDSLEIAEYEYCTFKNCNFESINLREAKFIDCHFLDCNLSLIQLYNTSIQNCTFTRCKMLGIQFPQANPFALSFSFNACILDHSNFYGLKLNKTIFTHCRMHQVDFESTELKEAAFQHCDLLGAKYYRTHLEKSDFLESVNFVIDPEQNFIKGAKFSTDQLANLLEKYKLRITS